MPEDIEINDKAVVSPEQKASGLQTFSHDMATAMKDSQGSVVKIAMAEQKKREEDMLFNSPSAPANKRYLLVTIILVAFSLLAIGLYFFLRTDTSTPATTTTETQAISSLIRAESHTAVALDSTSSDILRSRIAAASIATTGIRGTIDELYFVPRAGAPYGSVSVNTFWNLIGTTMPGSLSRTFGNKYMYGVYEGAATKVPFILMTTDSYQSAFAGMLDWERTMFDDVYEILGISVEGDNQSLFAQKFTDGTIKNKDARILRDAHGTPALLYVFLDDNTLLITPSAEPIDEISARLSATLIKR